MKVIIPTLILYFPGVAIARGSLFDFQSLFIIFLGICGIAAIVYFSFIAPSQIINKVSNKSGNDEIGYSIWFISLWTLFVPFLILSFFEIKINTILVVICWVFLVGIFFFKANTTEKKIQNEKIINDKVIRVKEINIKPSKSNFEWELTKRGIVNLKNGNLIPKNYLRQIDEPEPGCLIDNYLFRSEFIPEYKIKINSKTTVTENFPAEKISSFMTKYGIDEQSAINMINFKIDYQNGMFVYKNYFYEKLEDAVAYAKIDRTKN
jgi:hypothetical protein